MRRPQAESEKNPGFWKDSSSQSPGLTISSYRWLTGTIGSVVKIRWLKSISRATPVNLDPSGARQRTDPTNSVISVSLKVSVNTSVIN